MNHIKQSAVHAFLEEYARAVADLKNVIADIPEGMLVAVADAETQNPECRSIQTVLTHVVSSGFSYCVYIRHSRGKDAQRPAKQILSETAAYGRALDDMLAYTRQTFADIPDGEMEEYDEANKIKTAWGQSYDIEQMTEHALVHILRHRRQIEKFKHIVSAK